ncbi:hypothetical protein EPUS_05395 [Endocarpon pusillum Z07020]|uniref:Malic enzyme n=1 Tax=Endocarpon pusillum (strain Z07020 / HMAS-L-300199) TaxID=1263415 RepID=U1GCS3_ENDPU|nr:uncharacterized protein EPUS_05395 [Endocarpon pusillum Z07020]ERF69853.1 hypothetical protein EPUS_05395 [Endocarpon pusillum Z07020]
MYLLIDSSREQISHSRKYGKGKVLRSASVYGQAGRMSLLRTSYLGLFLASLPTRRTSPPSTSSSSFMTSMAEQNTVLYYRLILDHLTEMFSVERNLSRFAGPEDIDYIVVSDGEEILGIGDQGVGGVLIAVAKLVLMTACAGIHPNRTLPVVLDTGTDNQNLLTDELYLGLKRPRVRGREYDEFVGRFVQGARKRYPNAYIHFEDFGLENARRILDRYRPHIACFNDDIQGTGCVTLAAIMAALHVSGVKLTDMRMLVFGSGSAGMGIADQVRDAVATESDKTKEEAAKQIWCVDKPGLLLDSQGDGLTTAQKPFARKASEWGESKDTKNLQAIIREVKPHVLIGTSTRSKSFTKEVVQEMASHVDRPIIFPLSNPTRLHEADPKDIYEWTDGKALIATGSPFPPVKHKGKEYEVAECNNSTCFPGIGLGAVLSRSRLLSDKMLVAAVKALAAQSPALKDPNRGLLPDVTEVREISVKIAMAVIKTAVDEGHAQREDIPKDDGELEEWVRVQMWEAKYRELVPAKK